MSITQEQFDALKPGDAVCVGGSTTPRTVVGVLNGTVWASDDTGVAFGYYIAGIAAIIPLAPHPVACINFYAGDGTIEFNGDRTEADKYADADRTHVITIYSDGTTTTEAVS